MPHQFWRKQSGAIALGAGVTAASVYLVMIRVTLAHVEAVSGLIPFDMRPMGYGPGDAMTLLGALGAEGRSYYLTHQIPLDTIYPFLLAVFLIAMLRWIGQRTPGSRLVRLGIVLSIAAALCDYGENIGIFAMIRSWPAPSVPLVHVASAATIAKSVFTTLAVAVVAIVGLVRLRQRRSGLLA